MEAPPLGARGGVVILEGQNILRLRNTAAQYIAHQCNCVSQGAKGLARAIFSAFPQANNYHGKQRVPGTISIHPDVPGGPSPTIINMFAQRHPGGDPKGVEGQFTRQMWFLECLQRISEIPGIRSIAFPWGIGCGLAGGDWTIYQGIIEKWALDHPGIKVMLCKHDPHAVATTKHPRTAGPEMPSKAQRSSQGSDPPLWQALRRREVVETAECLIDKVRTCLVQEPPLLPLPRPDGHIRQRAWTQPPP